MSAIQPFNVYARIRPLNEKQHLLPHKTITPIDQNSLHVADHDRQFYFQVDHVFPETTDTPELFEQSVRPLLDNVINGINSTVFTYGITGAGKSFTMFGKYEKAGIIQLSLQYLFSMANENMQLKLSYLEIYNEQVFDLLRDHSQNLQIIDDPMLGVFVNDLEECDIEHIQKAMQLIAYGNARRAIAETKANQSSSRSHAIVQISIQNRTEDKVYSAKLSLVDLAGSEKQVVHTENKGLRTLEGSNINRSLLTLGNCITLLSEKRKSQFVPYRDSKLTRLLKDSLGGNTISAMIACISPNPHSLDETVNTMKYACRAKKIEKVVHQNVSLGTSIQHYQQEIQRLKKELYQAKINQSKHSNYCLGDLITQLIENVETLTIARMGDAHSLQEGMKEIDLMKGQQQIVSEIMTFEGKPKDLQRRKSIKTRDSTQNVKHLILNTEESKDSDEIQTELKMERTQKNEHRQSEAAKGYTGANLHNLRNRIKQNQRDLRELEIQYIHRSSRDQSVSGCQEEAVRLLENIVQDKSYWAEEDIALLQSIANGKQITSSTQGLRRINSAQDTKIPMRELSTNTLKCNRHLQTLSGLRKLTQKISFLGDQNPMECKQ